MVFALSAQSCRICFQSGGIKLRSIYTPAEDDDEPPSRMIEDLTGIHLEDMECMPEELPKKICKSCNMSLNMAYQFRLKALKSQDLIEEYLESNHKELKTVLDIKKEKEAGSGSPLTDENENQETEFIEDISEEDFQTTELTITENKPKNSKTPKIQKSDSVSEEDYEESNETKCLANDTSDEKDEDELLQKSFDENDCPMESLMDVGEEIIESIEEGEVMSEDYLLYEDSEQDNPEPQKVISSKTMKVIDMDKFLEEFDQFEKAKNHKSHICDICGNIFTHRARMMEHRKRHFPEKNYTCEICGEGFNIQEKLRKHMFLHSGKKPYKCSFCTRTFYYKSVKNNHEAIHNGSKPYVCEVCKKPFAYQHSLTKHKLIHDDIKLYHCSYCNKDFRLLHHFKQHQETRRHQNHVRIAEYKKDKDDVLA